MGGLLFILLIAFMFVGVPLLLPRLIIWLTGSHATSQESSQTGALCAPPVGETTLSQRMDGRSEETVAPGVVITLLRAVAGLILAVVWPLATFSLPFLFDDPREAAALVRFLYLALYFVYPMVFFVSAGMYKAHLRNGYYAKALAQAASPIGVLFAFSFLFWGISHLGP